MGANGSKDGEPEGRKGKFSLKRSKKQEGERKGEGERQTAAASAPEVASEKKEEQSQQGEEGEFIECTVAKASEFGENE